MIGLKEWTDFGNKIYTNLREAKSYFPRYKWTHKRICDWTPRRILEIGIGSGQALKELANLGHDCYGMDLENNILKVRESQHNHPDITYIVQSVDQPDTDWADEYTFNWENYKTGCDDRVHVVIIHYVLQHLIFDSNALYAIRKLLQPKGTLFATVPIADDNRHSAHAYNENTFVRLVEAIGFKVEEKEKLNRNEFIVMADKV